MLSYATLHTLHTNAMLCMLSEWVAKAKQHYGAILSKVQLVQPSCSSGIYIVTGMVSKSMGRITRSKLCKSLNHNDITTKTCNDKHCKST